MKWVTVSSVRDEGAVQVAEEALDELGIPVDVRRMSTVGPYMPASEVWEIRVPEEQAVKAEHAIARIAHELEESVAAQAESAAEQAPVEEEPRARPPRLDRAQVTMLVLVLVAAAGVFAYVYSNFF
jgi:hypothetical protein